MNNPKKTSQRCVIVMGDIVESRLQDARSLNRFFNESVAEINKEHKKEIISPLTITLGDEFQGLVTTLEEAFLIIQKLRFKLILHNISCRFVLGLGDIETRINKENAWNMLGTGLVAVRERLSDKKDFSNYRFIFSDNLTVQMLLDGVGMSLSHTEEKWTERQAHTVATAFLNSEYSLTEIFKMLEISKNTFYKILRAADHLFYNLQVDTVQEVLALLDEKYKLEKKRG